VALYVDVSPQFFKVEARSRLLLTSFERWSLISATGDTKPGQSWNASAQLALRLIAAERFTIRSVCAASLRFLADNWRLSATELKASRQTHRVDFISFSVPGAFISLAEMAAASLALDVATSMDAAVRDPTDAEGARELQRSGYDAFLHSEVASKRERSLTRRRTRASVMVAPRRRSRAAGRMSEREAVWCCRPMVALLEGLETEESQRA
ncbi:unnamed protein product, partial [Musa acuminata subsp. burmannicoides]